jgi:hypothetical protein
VRLQSLLPEKDHLALNIGGPLELDGVVSPLVFVPILCRLRCANPSL